MPPKRFNSALERVEEMNTGGRSAEDVTAEMHGVDPSLFANKTPKLTNINVADIHPDPTQPRRVLPSEVRAQWTGNSQDRAAILSLWFDMAQMEKGLPISVEDIINQTSAHTAEDDSTPVSEMGHLESSLMQLLTLAADIRANGLTNPISVVKDGAGGYILETGERRWWAFQLLYLLTQDEKWAKIPARVMETFSVWRQAAENNARQSLNAIGKARQFAILLMALFPEGSLQPLNAFEDEQAFYAQVADSARYGIPRNQGDRIVQSMGVANTVQLRQFRQLLRLPSSVWRYADDHNTALFKLRNALAVSTDESELLRYISVSADTATVPESLYANTLQRDPVKRGTSYKLYEMTNTMSHRFTQALKRKPANDEEADLVLQQLPALRQQLDELEAHLKKNR